jgi:hypothetical protein
MSVFRHDVHLSQFPLGRRKKFFAMGVLGPILIAHHHNPSAIAISSRNNSNSNAEGPIAGLLELIVENSRQIGAQNRFSSHSRTLASTGFNTALTARFLSFFERVAGQRSRVANVVAKTCIGKVRSGLSDILLATCSMRWEWCLRERRAVGHLLRTTATRRIVSAVVGIGQRRSARREATLFLQREFRPQFDRYFVGKVLGVSRMFWRRDNSRPPAEKGIWPHRYVNTTNNDPLSDHFLQFVVSLFFFSHDNNPRCTNIYGAKWGGVSTARITRSRGADCDKASPT